MADPTTSPSPKKNDKSKPRSRGRRITGRIFAGLAIIVLVAIIAGFAVVGIAYTKTDIPDPNSDFQTNTTFVYYRDGKSQLGNLAVQNRQSISYDEMPQNIKDAVLAAENRTFFTDGGISITGMTRAALAIARGGDVQGGSTITQQYIKIYYLNSERSLSRKFKELLLAVKLSREVSKDKVLEGYLNTIYFGRGAYGIQAASLAYFNVDAKDLTDEQAAVLASVLNNPGSYDPADGEETRARLLERYQYVISGMAEMGSITSAEAAEYKQALPKFPKIPTSSRYGGSNGFLMKMVEDELPAVTNLTPAQIAGGGYKVTTTFDEDKQADAVSAAKSNTKQAAAAAGKKKSKLHAAIASVDNSSGEVLALYGGPDFVKNSRNWATTARPTGSTFKAFALAAGLEDEFSLRSTFRGNTFTPPGSSTSVRNEFSMQYGPVTLLKATADSINTAFVDMTTQIPDGPKKIVKAAEAAGAPKGAGWDTGTDRISLGIPEVSPLDMASAYGTYANNGKHVPRHVIKEVLDTNGKVVYTAQTKGEQSVPEDVSRDVTHALSSVVESGTGRSVSTLGRPVAGKTGTAGIKDDVVSAWFVAYTKQISTAVMYVAGDDGNGDLDPYARPGDGTFFGGTYPASTWRDYMTKATEGQDVKAFDPPAWVNSNKVQTRQPQGMRTGEPAPQNPAPKPTKTTTTAKPEANTTTSKPAGKGGDKPSSTGGATAGGDATKEPTKQAAGKGDSKPTKKPATKAPKPQPTKQAPSGQEKRNNAPRPAATGSGG